jgi:cytochrome c oxidase subunit II
LDLRRATLPARNSWIKATFLAAGGAALAGCSGPLSTLDPAGPSAGAIANLFYVMFAGSVILFVLTIGLLLATLLKPGFGRSLSPHRWIVWGGLAMPVVVLTALVIFALAMGERLIASPLVNTPERVEARASQWVWTFSYPDREGAADTIAVLHIPAGEPVDIVITAEDVIHSFWVPRLGGKLDAIPGHENVLRLLADQPGTYGGVCAEFCGVGHANMDFIVQAHEPEDYAATVSGAATEASQ